MSGVSAGPARASATLDDDDASLLSVTEKLTRLQEEGLGDMDEFMDSFGHGQVATDDVKCDLCKHLLLDLNAGVSNLRTGVPEVRSSAVSESTARLNVARLPDSQSFS